jgi:hypothetical protein
VFGKLKIEGARALSISIRAVALGTAGVTIVRDVTLCGQWLGLGQCDVVTAATNLTINPQSEPRCLPWTDSKIWEILSPT